MASTAFWFFEPAGSPNIVNWPSGTVSVTIYAKVESPDGSHAYTVFPRLFRGQNQGSYTPYDTGTLTTPVVAAQTITTSWALYTFAVSVQALAGPTSDRLFLVVQGVRDDGGDGAGGIIHIGSDGGSNQTKVSPPFYSVPYSPPSLERNPDSTRPSQEVDVALNNSTGSLGSYTSLPGDPSLAIWKAGVWRVRAWVKVSGAPATLYADVGREPVGGGSPSLFGTNVLLGVVSSTTWVLIEKDIAVPQSLGFVGDTLYVAFRAQCLGAITTVSLGVGLNNPSSLNAPLLSPPGGPSAAPTDDHKVMVESDAQPGYLRDVVQSSGGSIRVTVDPASLKLNIETSPANFHTPMGVATETGGHAQMPFDASQASLVLAGAYLYSVDSNRFQNGDHIKLFISNASSGIHKTLVDGAAPWGTFYGLKLAGRAGTSNPISMNAPTYCEFWLDATAQCWRLCSLPVTYY